VIIRSGKILAAGALLPLGETTIHSERFGTRHRAALGTTEQTDAIVVVVSEENGQVSLVQRARIVRNLNESQLVRSLRQLLEPGPERTRLRLPAAVPGSRAPRLADIGRAVRAGRRDRSPAEPIPPDEPFVPDAPEAPAAATAPRSDVAGTGGDGTAHVTDGTVATQDPAATNGVPADAPTVELRQGEREPAGTRGQVR
jgi:hypothetical protein